MIDGLHVVVLVELVEHLHEGLELVFGQGDLVLRDHGDLRLQEGEPLLFEILSRFGEACGRRVDLVGVVFGDDVLRARVEGVLRHGVLVEIGRALDDDDALVVEHIGDAARRAEGAAVFAHDGAHVARGAVVVVGERRDDDGSAAHAVTFVGELLVVTVAEVARGTLDGALDVVVGHIRRLCLGDDVGKLGVGGRIGVAFCCDCKFSADLGEELAARGIRLTLLRLDIVPFAVS